MGAVLPVIVDVTSMSEPGRYWPTVIVAEAVTDAGVFTLPKYPVAVVVMVEKPEMTAVFSICTLFTNRSSLLANSEIAHITGHHLTHSRTTSAAAKDQASGQRVADHHIERIGRAIVDHVHLVETIRRQTDRVFQHRLGDFENDAAIHCIGIDQIIVVQARQNASQTARFRIVCAHNATVVAYATGGSRALGRRREADRHRFAIVHRAQMAKNPIARRGAGARLAVGIGALQQRDAEQTGVEVFEIAKVVKIAHGDILGATRAIVGDDQLEVDRPTRGHRGGANDVLVYLHISNRQNIRHQEGRTIGHIGRRRPSRAAIVPCVRIIGRAHCRTVAHARPWRSVGIDIHRHDEVPVLCAAPGPEHNPHSVSVVPAGPRQQR